MKIKGFTLIELLAVVLIMGILTAIAVPQYRSSLERSRITEAAQMLPAIFDSRARLAAEQTEDFDWRDLAFLNDRFSFLRLDMSMKGRTAQGDEVPEGREKHHYWVTDNFIYGLVDNKEDIGGVPNEVSAQLLRGKFAGAILYFDGQNMRCCRAKSLAKDACDLINVPVLQEGC